MGVQGKVCSRKAALRELHRRLVVQRRMQALVVVLGRCSLPSTFASINPLHSSRFRNSSRNRLLKLPLEAFCHELPGLM